MTDQSNLEFELTIIHFMGLIMVRKLSIRGTETSPTQFRIPVFASSRTAAMILRPINNGLHSDQLNGVLPEI